MLNFVHKSILYAKKLYLKVLFPKLSFKYLTDITGSVVTVYSKDYANSDFTRKPRVFNCNDY